VLRWTLPAFRAFFARHQWTTLAVEEEPLSLAAAASHVGVARSIHRHHLRHPLRRRLTIARAWLDVMSAPAARRAGVSLYVSASLPS
jgi:hypothetical protein